ncbi:MAG: riboflavin biosynthesis protein RibD, partial [Gammaproteobacteria bacterium]
FEVLRAGSGRMVEGAPLAAALAQRGFQSQHLLAGPKTLDTMVRDKCLCRLYLTMTHQLIGGENFHSLTPGPELGEAGDLTLLSLYYDPWSPERAGQLFGQYEVTG